MRNIQSISRDDAYFTLNVVFFSFFGGWGGGWTTFCTSVSKPTRLNWSSSSGSALEVITSQSAAQSSPVMLLRLHLSGGHQRLKRCRKANDCGSANQMVGTKPDGGLDDAPHPPCSFLPHLSSQHHSEFAWKTISPVQSVSHRASFWRRLPWLTWDNFNIVILLRSSTFSSPQLTTEAALMSRNPICVGGTREKPLVDRGCLWFPL